MHRRLQPVLTAAALSVIAALSPTAASAQQADVLPKSQRLPGSTRAMSLGDSYVMDSGHADALFYHPALLTGASGFGAELQRWGPNSSAAAVSAAVQWFGGGVGVGLRSLQYGVVGGASPVLPAGQDHLFESGPDQVSERVVTIGFARGLWWDIDVGVAVDLVDERVGSQSESAVLFDVGASRELGPLVVGITASDIGEKPVLDSGNGPASIVLGAGAYGHPVGAFDLGVAAHLGLEDDEAIFGGGIEIGYWPIQGRTFVARVGFQHVPEGSHALPITTGFAFRGDDITVEWAFHPVRDADEGGSHRFALRWR